MPSKPTVLLESLLLATPTLILWLWSVIVPARVAILCPKECQCDTGGYYVECDGTSLNPVPLIHPTDVRTLWLTEKNITLLERDSFVSPGFVLLQPEISFSSSYATRLCELFPICTSLTWL